MRLHSRGLPIKKRTSKATAVRISQNIEKYTNIDEETHGNRKRLPCNVNTTSIYSKDPEDIQKPKGKKTSITNEILIERA